MDDNITLLDLILIFNLNFLIWLLNKIFINKRIQKIKNRKRNKGRKFYWIVKENNIDYYETNGNKKLTFLRSQIE